MTNLLYDPFIKTMMAPGNASNGHGGQTIDLLSDNIHVVLVNDDSSGSYSFAGTNDFFDDLGIGVVDATNGDAQLANTTFQDIAPGVAFDADNVQMTSVGDGSEPVNALVIYDNSNSGTEAEQALIAFIDTGTGFDFTPNGTTVDITWAGSPNYIWQIG